LAGGAGSGKGFTLSKLIGIEGIVFDVDRIKELAMASTKLSASIKDKTGHDITKLNLKNPENVSLLHGLLANDFKVTSNMDKKAFTGILAADPSRKPNLIFDVTLKDMQKLSNISKQIKELGYDRENIHIVWVMNDVNIAIEQNKTRSRSVPVEVLLATHEGASMTFKKLMAIGEGARSLSDGDWWIAFNKAKVDVTLEKSENGGSYITKANYMIINKKSTLSSGFFVFSVV